MASVATLHVRNVPQDVYDALRRRAARTGRSLNAVALEILDAAAAREERRDSQTPITDALRRLAYKIDLPPDAPRPEELIRRMRDA
jgi:plasmid stability protein